MAAAAQSANLQLVGEMARFYADPLGFVLFAYPWGEPGELRAYDGPDEWQREVLAEIGKAVRERDFNGHDPVAPIRAAIASGHGIGKSTIVAWLVDWIMSTRPGAIGTITANTFTQLSSKTWAAIRTWTRRCITAHWFDVGSDSIKAIENPSGWKCQAQTCDDKNSEAFAGQHAAASTSFYIFDEASAVPDSIWDVAEGGLTDGEPMIFAFGNPTRSSGKFYRVCFGSDNSRWLTRSIDSRTAKMTNKAQIDEWIADYGEDSDFVRVRVRGLPPAASELQFIDRTRVDDATKRLVSPLEDEPLIAGFDVSGGGAAWSVIRFRRGQDARSIPPVRVPGEKCRDRGLLIGICAELLRDERPDRKIAAMFVDSAFGSPIVERLHTLGFDNVQEVSFGAQSPDQHQANWRAYMWQRCKDWLLTGSIPPEDEHGEPDRVRSLAVQLCSPGYHINKANKLVIESKQEMVARGEASPDDGDALVLTFARPVAPLVVDRWQRSEDGPHYGTDSWMA